MFDPSQLTLGQLSSSLKDFAIVGFLVGFAWKARGFYELASNFFTRISTHMDVMEDGMDRLLTNHLPHIEQEIAGRKGEYVHILADAGPDPLLEK